MLISDLVFFLVSKESFCLKTEQILKNRDKNKKFGTRDFRLEIGIIPPQSAQMDCLKFIGMYVCMKYLFFSLIIEFQKISLSF